MTQPKMCSWLAMLEIAVLTTPHDDAAGAETGLALRHDRQLQQSSGEEWAGGSDHCCSSLSAGS
jgi:hypothetical protein